MCRDFVIWHGVHGADWVEAGHRAQHGHSNGVQNTLGDQCGDVCVWMGGMVGGLVVAGASWGCGKNVVNLTQSSQCPCKSYYSTTNSMPMSGLIAVGDPGWSSAYGWC